MVRVKKIYDLFNNDFSVALNVYLFTYLITYLLTYLLTAWCRVLLEKLTGLQLVKKFPAFHGTRRFITALTSVRHLSLSRASPIESICPHPTSWRSHPNIIHPSKPRSPQWSPPSGFPSKNPYNPSPHPYAPHAQPISFFSILSSSSALQLFMSFGLLSYFVPLLPLLRSVSSSSLPFFSDHFSRHLPILILAFLSVLLRMGSIYICLDFFTHTVLGEEYKSFSSSLCNHLHSPVTSSFLGPNILLNDSSDCTFLNFLNLNFWILEF